MPKIFNWIFILSLVLVLAGCNLPGGVNGPTNAVPQDAENGQPTLDVKIVEESPIPPPTPVTGPVFIAPENAAGLAETNQAPLNNPFGLSWSLDSTRVGAVTQEGLLMFDANNLAVTANVVIQQPVSLLDFSSETLLMATTGDQQNIELRNIETGEVARTLQSQGTFSAAVFSPDGRLLAVPMVDDVAVEMWDVENGTLITTYRGFETAAPVYGISFSRSGRSLIWVSRSIVQVMDLQTGQLGPLSSFEDFVGGTGLTPDGQILAVSAAGTDGETAEPFILLSDAASGDEIARIASGEFIASSLDFSADGQLLFSGRNNDVVVWDLSTQQELATLQGHTDRVTSVSVSPDGMMLASASADGTLRIWRVQ